MPKTDDKLKQLYNDINDRIVLLGSQLEKFPDMPMSNIDDTQGRLSELKNLRNKIFNLLK